MATQPERIASLEEFRNSHGQTFKLIVSGLACWLATITVWLFIIKGDLQAIKQRLKDGGTEDVVSELKSDTNIKSAEGQLNIIQGNVQLAVARHKPPNEEKLNRIAPAVADSAKRFPNSPVSWQTVAVVASYRTAALRTNTSTRPPCDIKQPPHKITPDEVPESRLSFGDYIGIGFVFKDCTLRMDQLPPGHLAVTTTTGPYNSGDHVFPAGTKVVGGYMAYVVNCDIVLGDSGIAESPITLFYVIGCRLQYDLQEVPKPQTQRFLLASIEANNPGEFQFKSDPSLSGGTDSAPKS